MKRVFLNLAGLIIGIIGGYCLGVFVWKVADDNPRYAPDRMAAQILAKPTILGTDSGSLLIPKAMVGFTFQESGAWYWRMIGESPRFVVVLTTENDLVIEADVYDRTLFESVRYEADSEAMARFAQAHRAWRLEEERKGSEQ